MELRSFLEEIIEEYGKKIEYFAQETVKNPQESENLHQFRVFTRRLRSILKEFEDYFEQESLQKILQRLREYQNMSNHARDIDVFLINLPSYVNHLPPSMQKDFFIIEDILKKMQKEAYELLLPKLQKVDISILEEIQFSKEADVNAKKAIKDRIKRRYKGICKYLSKDLDDAMFHALRIKFKKLRYVFELLVRLEGNHKKDLKSLKKIQDILGAVQDRRVQCEHLRDFAKNQPLEIETLLALGKVIGDLELEKEQYKLQFKSKFKNFQKEFKI